jgi:hypothetical protein
MRGFQESVKDNVHLAQACTRFSHPSHPKTSIQQLKIPRTLDVIPEGLGRELVFGSFDAELLEWKRDQDYYDYCNPYSREANPSDIIIIFAHVSLKQS